VYISALSLFIYQLLVCNLKLEQINHFLLFGTRINIPSARQKNPARVSFTENLYLAPVTV
jgi:hypothetical protein